ncbi:MAG: hypothetical protein HY762_00015 [Planctomycetes bacterium]|nr:hypothetical protein [Planctomycetota bacterium]
MIRKLLILTALLSLMAYASVAPAEEISSSTEAFIKKYTLNEYFELGIETAFIFPDRNNTLNMGNLYIALSHTTEEFSTFKFRTGYVSGDYEVASQTTGRFYYTNMDVTFLGAVRSGNLKPYYGLGAGYYFFEKFRPARSVYKGWGAENTFGYHALLGAKYIFSEWGFSVGGEVAHEWVKPFRFFNVKEGVYYTPTVRKVDFSNLSLTLSIALHF